MIITESKYNEYNYYSYLEDCFTMEDKFAKLILTNSVPDIYRFPNETYLLRSNYLLSSTINDMSKIGALYIDDSDLIRRSRLQKILSGLLRSEIVYLENNANFTPDQIMKVKNNGYLLSNSGDKYHFRIFLFHENAMNFETNYNNVSLNSVRIHSSRTEDPNTPNTTIINSLFICIQDNFMDQENHIQTIILNLTSIAEEILTLKLSEILNIPLNKYFNSSTIILSNDNQVASATFYTGFYMALMEILFVTLPPIIRAYGEDCSEGSIRTISEFIIDTIKNQNPFFKEIGEFLLGNENTNYSKLQELNEFYDLLSAAIKHLYE